MTFEELHNALVLMHSFTRDELCRNGIIESHDAVAWEEFTQSPSRFFLGDDSRAERFFKAMQLRLPPNSGASKR